MKYKIKITTFENGRKEYNTYVKKRFYWMGLDSSGMEDLLYSTTHYIREQAISAIDKHREGSSKVKEITFEYLSKQLH